MKGFNNTAIYNIESIGSIYTPSPYYSSRTEYVDTIYYDNLGWLYEVSYYVYERSDHYDYSMYEPTRFGAGPGLVKFNAGLYAGGLLLGAPELISFSAPKAKSIGFYSCYKLQTAELGENISAFGDQNFLDCRILSEVTLLYDGVVSIPSSNTFGQITPVFRGTQYSKYYSGPCHIYVPDSWYSQYRATYSSRAFYSNITRLSERPY